MNLPFRVFFLLFFCSRLALAQPPDSPKQLLSTLRTQTFEGNKTALRDLGSALGRAETNAQASRFLHDACFFFDPKWPAARLGKAAYFDFFYKNRDRFFYDHLLDAWLMQPIENQQVVADIRPFASAEHPNFLLKKWGSALSAALEKRDSAAIFDALEQLVFLENSASLLFSTAKKLDKNQPRMVFAWFAHALAASPTDNGVDLILKWAEERSIAGDQAEYALEVALNHYIGTDVPEVEAQRVRFWRDSLGTLDAIRQHGFEAEIGARPSFFEHEVDYWGLVLSQTGNLPWVRRNAVLALARTHHPRSIYYLATQAMKLRENARFRSFPGSKAGVLRQIEHLTNQKTAVPDTLGRTVLTADDRVWAFNYAAFWAKNHENYEWDTRRQTFTNRELSGSLAEETDRLFRHLSSPNDSIARDSYQKLTEADPATVLEKIEQFRQMVRSFNPLLPSFKYKYLEVLVQLTDFCAEAGQDWRGSAKVDSVIAFLEENPPQKMRYLIENQAVASLDLTDATALEYAACLRERNVDFNFSASRILDRLYSRHWEKLRDEPAQLRLFLKKAALFSQIGTVGVCNFYLQKTGWRAPLPEKKTIDGKLETGANLPPEKLETQLVKALTDLEKGEYDEDILRMAAKLLNNAAREKLAATTWEQFFLMPESLKINELASLPKMDKKGRIVFLKKFEVEKSPARAARYLDYLEQNPEAVWSGALLKMLDDPRRDSVLNVPKRAVFLLNKIMQPDFGTAPMEAQIAAWKNFQSKLGNDFTGWQERIFNEKLDRLQGRDSLSVMDLNDVLQSQFFRPKHRMAVFSALKKVRPVASIKRLNLSAKLQIPEDLAFFERLPFNYRDLDDLTRLFQNDKPDQLLDFYLRKSADFSVEEKGLCINEIMRQDWLGTYINTLAAPTELTQKLKLALLGHLENDDLSEFEEQATILHLLFLENIGVSFREKLVATFTLSMDSRAKAQLQREILAGVPWSQLADVAPLFEQFSTDENGHNVWQFLTTDFGLPPENFAQNPDNQLFIKKLKEHTQPEVIRFYLEQFGLKLPDLSKNDPQDFQKIADMLAFEVTTPFVGGGGERRDWFVFGTIKLLENHFGTRLGFHEKLNENQTFYTYNASKRALAWRRFLAEKGFISAKTAGGMPFIH